MTDFEGELLWSIDALEAGILILLLPTFTGVVFWTCLSGFRSLRRRLTVLLLLRPLLPAMAL